MKTANSIQIREQTHHSSNQISKFLEKHPITRKLILCGSIIITGGFIIAKQISSRTFTPSFTLQEAVALTVMNIFSQEMLRYDRSLENKKIERIS